VGYQRRLVGHVQRRHSAPAAPATINSANITIDAKTDATAATLLLSGTAALFDQGGLELGTSLEVGSGTTFDLDGGSLGVASSAGALIDFGGLFEGTGSYTGALTDNGTVEATQGSLTLGGSLSGTGNLQIEPGTTIALEDDVFAAQLPVATGLTADFPAAGDGTGQLTMGVDANFNGPTLANLNYGDTITITFGGSEAPTYDLDISNSTLQFGNGFYTGTFDLGSGLVAPLAFIMTSGIDSITLSMSMTATSMSAARRSPTLARSTSLTAISLRPAPPSPTLARSSSMAATSV
jgi:hypothetical protein